MASVMSHLVSTPPICEHDTTVYACRGIVCIRQHSDALGRHAVTSSQLARRIHHWLRPQRLQLTHGSNVVTFGSRSLAYTPRWLPTILPCSRRVCADGPDSAMAALRFGTLLVAALLATIIEADQPSEGYTRQWAVHIAGGAKRADAVAGRHDFINLGKVGVSGHVSAPCIQIPLLTTPPGGLPFQTSPPINQIWARGSPRISTWFFGLPEKIDHYPIIVPSGYSIQLRWILWASQCQQVTCRDFEPRYISFCDFHNIVEI